MKKNILFLGTILTAATLVAGQVKAENIYLGFGGGINMPADSNIRGDNDSTSVDLDSGWVGKGFVGYDFGNSWRTELELGHRKNSNGNSANTNGTGDVKVWSAMGNVIYDIDINKPVVPFVGLGLGYAWFDPDKISPLNGGHGALSENSSAVAYQAFVGASYNFYKNLDLALEYNYFQTSGQGAKTSNSFSVDSDYKSHDILFSLKWNLGKDCKTKKSKKNYAVIPSNYLVFFNFDEAKVTPEAEDIIKSASQSFKQNKSTVIELTGHTDKSGSKTYNMGLSKRRAESVMAKLEKLGVPKDAIMVYAKGESKPLIPTPDGIRELQNRRVEIVIKD